MIEYADERYYRWLDSILKMNMIYEQEMEEAQKTANNNNTTENEKEN